MRWFLRSFSTQAILWFYDLNSVWLLCAVKQNSGRHYHHIYLGNPYSSVSWARNCCSSQCPLCWLLSFPFSPCYLLPRLSSSLAPFDHWSPCHASAPVQSFDLILSGLCYAGAWPASHLVAAVSKSLHVEIRFWPKGFSSSGIGVWAEWVLNVWFYLEKSIVAVQLFQLVLPLWLIAGSKFCFLRR